MKKNPIRIEKMKEKTRQIQEKSKKTDRKLRKEFLFEMHTRVDYEDII